MAGLNGALPPQHRVVHDAQAQTRAAHSPGTGLVHTVEALKHMAQIFVGDAHAVVLHPDDHSLSFHRHIGVDKAAAGAVFDAVFHDIVQNLVNVVFRGHDHGVGIRLITQGYALFLGHHPQHPLHPFQHRGHRHSSTLFQRTAVQSGQAQQILGDAAEPLGLLPDVAHEFVHRLGVHVLRLQNRVGQQADTGQRCLQFMGCVGHKAASGIFGGLQPVGQTVEFRRNLGDLIVALHLGPVTVSTLPHVADGLQQFADASRQHPGEQQAQHNNKDCHHAGNAGNVVLQALEQLRLLRVVLIGIDGTHRLVMIHHRRSAAAEESIAVIAAIIGVLAPQRLKDLGVKGVKTYGTAGFTGVVQHPAGRVGYQNATHACLFHHRQRLADILRRQILQTAQG